MKLTIIKEQKLKYWEYYGTHGITDHTHREQICNQHFTQCLGSEEKLKWQLPKKLNVKDFSHMVVTFRILL